MPRIGGLVGLLIAWALLPGCEKPPPAQPPNETTTAPGGDLDRLRALPYAGDVENESPDAGDGVVRMDRARMQSGYTLYTANKLCLADLIDESGKSIRSWSMPDSLHWYQADLQTNGDLLVVGCDPAASGKQEVSDDKRYLARLAWDGRILWKRVMTAHHDVETTPQGKLLTMTIRHRLAPELHETVELREEFLALLEPDGRQIEEISLYDLMRSNPELFPIQPVKPSRLGARMELDLTHANSIEWMKSPELAGRDSLYSLDNVLVCFRHQDRIAIINWPQRKLVWAWGAGELSGPHDASVLPNGNILLFDNGIARKRSRAVEMDPIKKSIVWQYDPDPPDQFFSLTKGSAQRLANGDTLIANSDSGQAFEVTPDGKRVWEYFCPHRGADGKRGTIVRAIRYDREIIDALRNQAPESKSKASPPAP
ncbi:MAG: aryl-sulfate sulfotransferase [Planctomycetes bacterium]|nr:aryl-sulfate sulfotransferase [Planctomycetota bacterium]